MNGTDSSPLTPQQRLALSRRALVRQLHGGRDAEPAAQPAFGSGAYADADDGLEALGGEAPQDPRAAHGGALPWLPMARSMAERWWRRHPAHAAGQLARPLLERYARKQPAKLMAIAAATGAVIVLVRPWRLLSFTAVLAAVLKTSDLADVVNTLMQQKNTSPRKDPR